MTADEVRGRLVMLETMRLVSGRGDPDSLAPRRVFHLTAEGRGKAGAATRGREMPESDRRRARWADPSVSEPVGETTAAILAWLDRNEPATAMQIGQARSIDGISMRGRLAMLARQGLVSSHPNRAKPPRNVYRVTAEGRRRAGIGEVRRTADR